MPVVSMRAWGMLGRWSGTAFLVAGGLFLLSPAAKGLVLLTDVSPHVWLVAPLVFSGLSASLVGLLGLYPRLTTRTPRLSLAGVVATVIAGAVTLGTFAWLMGAHLLPRVPGTSGLPAPPAIVFVTLILSLATAYALFGVASAWTAIPSRTAGGLLLALATPWIFLVVAHSMVSSLPAWLSITTYGVIPVVMLVLGHHLRTRTAPTGGETPSSEPITA